MSFAESTGDATIKMVDNMLDALTNGEHSKVQWQIDQVNILLIYLHLQKPLITTHNNPRGSKGIKQSDTISPMLFTAYHEMVIGGN